MAEQNIEEGSSAAAGRSGGVGGKVIGVVVVVLVIALGVYVLTRGQKEENGIGPEAASTQKEADNTPAADTSEITTPANNDAAPVEGEQPFPRDINQADGSVTVVFTDSGYTPKDITIKVNKVVNFKNESTIETWPASAMHPTHAVYPGSDINKCGTSAQAGIFDACRGLKTGETWSFQFGEVGTWKYHDHLNPSKFGSITVTE